MADHADHEAVLCNVIGGDQLLPSGESFTFTIDVEVQPSSDLIFTNIAFIPPTPSADPDGAAFGAAFGSGDDFITYLGDSVNNVAYAQYPLPPEPSISSGAGDASGGGGLAESGYPIWGMVAAAATLIAGGVAIWLYRRRVHI